MHCSAPLFDYSHFEPPQRFLAPKDNPLIPPRVDRGETKERPACLEKESARLSLLHLLAPSMSNAKDKRMRKATSEMQVARKGTVSSQEDRPRKSEKSSTSRASAIKHSIRSFRVRSNTSTTSDSNISRSPRDNIKSPPRSPRDKAISSASPVTELQKARALQSDIHLRLKELEGIVARLQSDLQTAEESARERLEEQLTEQVTLLSALRMHAKIVDERHEEGYLEMRVANANSVSADDSVLAYSRYWFYLNFPHFCCYDNQQDDNPSGVITLSTLMQVIPAPNDKKAFTVIPDKGYSVYQFRAENVETATRWMKAICRSAEIPLGKREKETTLKSPRVKEPRDGSRSVITRVKDAFRSEYSSRECIAADLDEFTTWCNISDQFKTQAFEDQEKQIFYRLSGGTPEDLLFWIFYFFPLDAAVKSSSGRVLYCEELAAFLNSAPVYCTPEQAVNSLIGCWTYFNENGFPPVMGAVGMQSRLYYITRQWLLSDSVYEDIVGEMEARKQLRDFAVSILDRERREKTAAITFVQVLENKSTEMQYMRPEPYVPSTRNELIECEVEDIALQLTVAAALLFSKINKRELMSFLRGDEGDGLDAVANVNAYNSKLVRWTITLILNASNPKTQLHLYKKLYRVARRLFELSNYNDCSSVLEGLLDVSVQSLQGLQEMLSQKIIQKIRKLAIIFSPLSDYARFRALPSKEGHMIPFMEYELQRLLRIEHELPSFLPQSSADSPPLLNLQKMVTLWKAVESSTLCRASLVDFTSSIFIDHSLQKLIREINPLEYEELNKLSISQEPTRNVRSVLEMEIAERDAEIEELQEQNQRHERERLQVVRDLGLDPTTLQPSHSLTPANINQEQLHLLLSLLASERAKNNSQ